MRGQLDMGRRKYTENQAFFSQPRHEFIGSSV